MESIKIAWLGVQILRELSEILSAKNSLARESGAIFLVQKCYRIMKINTNQSLFFRLLWANMARD
jgi:hypothetical protein